MNNRRIHEGRAPAISGGAKRGLTAISLVVTIEVVLAALDLPAGAHACIGIVLHLLVEALR